MRAVSLAWEATLRATSRAAPILYHVGVVVLSAAIALSLPLFFTFLAKNLLRYWSLVENEGRFLTAIEVLIATGLILFFNFLRKSWSDRRFARVAKAAGMVYFTSSTRFLGRRRIRGLRERQALGKDIAIVGSTGFRTFVDPRGDLHKVIRNARAVRIMLLNPYTEGASARAKAILDPEVTPEKFGEQIHKSIEFLRALRTAQRNVRLKLYPDAPFLKLAILGDYLWVQHYHAGLHVRMMPECMLRYDQTPEGLYVIFYQYFLTRWNSPEIPEYDFETDELVYRTAAGKEIKRKPFHGAGGSP